jgi:hypothetical protein
MASKRIEHYISLHRQRRYAEYRRSISARSSGPDALNRTTEGARFNWKSQADIRHNDMPIPEPA